MIFEIQYREKGKRKFVKYAEKFTIEDAVWCAKALFWSHTLRIVKRNYCPSWSKIVWRGGPVK